MPRDGASDTTAGGGESTDPGGWSPPRRPACDEGSCGAAWLKLLLVPSLIGGVVGALLVSRLPNEVFKAVLPWLLLTAAGLYLLQPWLTKLTQGRREGEPPVRFSRSGSPALIIVSADSPCRPPQKRGAARGDGRGLVRDGRRCHTTCRPGAEPCLPLILPPSPRRGYPGANVTIDTCLALLILKRVNFAEDVRRGLLHVPPRPHLAAADVLEVVAHLLL